MSASCPRPMVRICLPSLLPASCYVVFLPINISSISHWLLHTFKTRSWLKVVPLQQTSLASHFFAKTRAWNLQPSKKCRKKGTKSGVKWTNGSFSCQDLVGLVNFEGLKLFFVTKTILWNYPRDLNAAWLPIKIFSFLFWQQKLKTAVEASSWNKLE